MSEQLIRTLAEATIEIGQLDRAFAALVYLVRPSRRSISPHIDRTLAALGNTLAEVTGDVSAAHSHARGGQMTSANVDCTFAALVHSVRASRRSISAHIDRTLAKATFAHSAADGGASEARLEADAIVSSRDFARDDT